MLNCPRTRAAQVAIVTTTPVVKERKHKVKTMLKRNKQMRMKMVALGRKIQKKRRKLIEQF